ncbi:hypothetical protein PHMEG_00018210 [Phytophthora megakarya]|uniref:Uncharacterized protein n=1 Tax=Phytophthora megakarya TaxID=4795 RepID=A0A225VVE0_9STRA|nr:hypothetical protein PHMEG_00018210 [Phytophthora megakarya]
MKISALPALFVAVATTPHVIASFTTKPGPINVVTPPSDHAKFTKQWTIERNTKRDDIQGIGLDLGGAVFVNHIEELPPGVLGYVNVTGDSKTIVDAVTMFNNNASNHNSATLNVTTTTPPQEGYLLTEIFLSSILFMESVSSAQVVIEEDVFSMNNKDDDLILALGASGSSSIFASDTGSSATVATMLIETSGSASIQFRVASISLDDVQLTSAGYSSIALLASSIETTGDMILVTEDSGSICTTAKQVTVPGDFLNVSPSGVSFPNAANKHGTKGTLACAEVKRPAREPALVSTAKMTKAAKSDSIPSKENGKQNAYTFEVGDGDDDDETI